MHKRRGWRGREAFHTRLLADWPTSRASKSSFVIRISSVEIDDSLLFSCFCRWEIHMNKRSEAQLDVLPIRFITEIVAYRQIYINRSQFISFAHMGSNNKSFFFFFRRNPIGKTLCWHLSSDDDNKTQSSKQFALNFWCSANTSKEKK